MSYYFPFSKIWTEKCTCKRFTFLEDHFAGTKWELIRPPRTGACDYKHMQRIRIKIVIVWFFLSVPYFWFCPPNYHLEMVALVQRPAPTFKAEAVVDGLFLDISLVDYLGQWYVDYNLYRSTQRSSLFARRVGLFFSSTQCWYFFLLFCEFLIFLTGTSPLSARRECHLTALASLLLVRTAYPCWSFLPPARFLLLMMLCRVSKNSTLLYSVGKNCPNSITKNNLHVIQGISTDSKFSHFAWATQSRKEGGLGPDLKLPLIADRNMNISRNYGVLLEDEGISLRGLFIIDPKGTLRWASVLGPERLWSAFFWKANYRQRSASWSFSRGNYPTPPSFPVHCTSIHFLFAFCVLHSIGYPRWSLPCKLESRLQDYQTGPHCQTGVLLGCYQWTQWWD